MKNEILEKFVAGMMEALKTAKDFTLEQAPDVMKQVIRLAIVESALVVAGSIAVLFGLWRWHRHIQTKIEKRSSYFDEPGFAYIPLAIIGVVALMSLSCSGDDLVKASVAPKLYLIEYFSHLVRGGCK